VRADDVKPGEAEGGAYEPLYTTAQVAERMQVSIDAVRAAIRGGRLGASLPAGRRRGYRIPESEVQHWLTATRHRKSWTNGRT
jgi:excisionase family DNA binding protein